MLHTVLSGKIHRATVTGADQNYIGSITIDKMLIDAAGFKVFEQVHVLNITNGQRLVTYVIEGEAHSGVVVLNGAAARATQVGDKVIILSYGILTAQEVSSYRPNVVFVDESNYVVEVKSTPEGNGLKHSHKNVKYEQLVE